MAGYGRKLLLAVCFALLPVPTAYAASEPRLSAGQTVYVPVYANIYSAPKAIPFPLATLLSIRSTDLHHPLTVTGADFYDTKGKLVKKFLEKPVVLAPLETTYIYITEKDAAGGAGANFIVRWHAAREVNMPIIEALMLGTKSGQGISFVSPGQPISEETR